MGFTHNIGILFQNCELDAGNFYGEQTASSDSGDACAYDGDLELRLSHSLLVMIRRKFYQLSNLEIRQSDVPRGQRKP